MNAALKHVTLVAALALSIIYSAAKSVALPVQVEDSESEIETKQSRRRTVRSTIVSMLEIEMVIETTRRTRVAITDQNA